MTDKEGPFKALPEERDKVKEDQCSEQDFELQLAHIRELEDDLGQKLAGSSSLADLL